MSKGIISTVNKLIGFLDDYYEFISNYQGPNNMSYLVD
jgi:hypothetical protein